MMESSIKFRFRRYLEGIQAKFAGKIFPMLEKFTFFIRPKQSLSDQSMKELDRLVAQLDYIETIPVRFDGEADELFQFWIEQAEPWMEDGRIARRVVALKYRLDSANGGVAPEGFSESAFEKLRLQAIEWKKTEPLLKFTGMSAKESAHLKAATHYPLFTDLLQKHPEIRVRFFQWILRDENDVQPFVQFPAATERLLECGLSGRISRFGGGALKILRERLPDLNGEQKILTLPFEGKDISILDPSLPVHFSSGYTLTMEQIFDVFKRKDIAVGDLEFMAEGIVNWNIHQLAVRSKEETQRIDVTRRKWWEQMPLFELLNRRQIWKRYGISLKPRQWIAAACATRGRPNLDYEETHAYLEVAIPRGKGLYAVYDFGKLALKYPETVMEKMSMFTKNVHATVAFPDENVYYSHRQKGFEPFALSPRQGEELMSLLRRDIESSRKLNFIYQIESENCAKWVHHVLEEVVGHDKMPDLFRMQLLDTQPQGPVALLFRWIKQLPARWQVPVLAHLHLPLGAFRKIWIWEEGRKVAKSLSSHSFFETGQIYLPALLVEKVMTAEVAVTIFYWGILRLQKWKGFRDSLVSLWLRMQDRINRRSEQKWSAVLESEALCRNSRFRQEAAYAALAA
jgi:hypothetical protein